MFKKLISKIFKKKAANSTNLYYFEDLRKSEAPKEKVSPDIQHNIQQSNSADNHTNNQPLRYFSFEEEYHQAFYDYLFGMPNSFTSSHNDELSEFISEKVESLLKNPKLILDALPILPMSLTKIIEQLNNDDFDADELISLIQQEPAIAAKVLELANSTYYNRNGKEVIDLKSAFMVLGAQGLSEGVINGFVNKLVPQSSIYFRQYGQKIWQHSLSTGINAKTLVAKSNIKNDAAQAYFIGLISNLGDVIIYQLMIDAFDVVHPDCQPNSTLFKSVMAKNSKKLTYFIAKHWNFPSSILEVLALQTKVKRAALLPALHQKLPVACYVYEAKLISELQLRMTKETLADDYIDEIKTSLLFTDEATDYLNLVISKNKIES
ncbi:MAG: HDOD domain-containing protein [Colwellia polaris]|jgi:HD-like signal output (HDOD) protein